MKMVAIHEIVRGAGKDRETIAPEAVFEASKEEREELLHAGAARDAEVEDKPKAAAKGGSKKSDPEAEDSVI